jgi:hypothetical protein
MRNLGTFTTFTLHGRYEIYASGGGNTSTAYLFTVTSVHALQ